MLPLNSDPYKVSSTGLSRKKSFKNCLKRGEKKIRELKERNREREKKKKVEVRNPSLSI